MSKNLKVSGTGEILQPIKLLNKKLWALLIKPKSNYSTKNIFESFNNSFAKTTKFELTLNNLINDMNKYNNSLEKTVCRIEKNVKNVLSYLYNFKSLTLPRITGSGSTVFVLFKTKEDLKIYKKKTKFWRKRLLDSILTINFIDFNFLLIKRYLIANNVLSWDQLPQVPEI